jgi:hypothetical protein
MKYSVKIWTGESEFIIIKYDPLEKKELPTLRKKISMLIMALIGG